MANDLETETVNKIMEERIQIGLDMTKKIVTNNNLKLSDYELMDIAVRCGMSLFIEKNKSYRASKIKR